MKVFDLFCGTKSIASVALERGHEVFTVDNNSIFQADYQGDILGKINFPFIPDMIWASPPCQGFSVATIGRSWDKETNQPKTDTAKMGIRLVEKTIEIISTLKPKFWFIENPRAKLRVLPLVQGYRRVTTTYCQYGDTRMKPTDIWTNTDIQLKPPCKNGSPCHISAPRGSKTGTQGLKDATERGKIPRNLCLEIIKYCEGVLK